MNERIKAFMRILVTAVAMINAILVAKGISPIPFDETAVTQFVSDAVAGAATFWVWWKNNNITKEAMSAQLHLNELKKGYSPDDGEMENMENENIKEGELNE